MLYQPPMADLRRSGVQVQAQGVSSQGREKCYLHRVLHQPRQPHRSSRPAGGVIRLTINDDLTTPAGLDKAFRAINTPNAIIILFGALPCTGGSQWQRLNWHRGDANTRRKILEHRRIFRVLWKNFVIAAEQCIALEGGVAFEWPRGCTYWHDRSVRSFIKRHNLTEIQFDGCMYGLTSHVPGMPIRKPWMVATTIKEMSLLGRKCDQGR